MFTFTVNVFPETKRVQKGINYNKCNILNKTWSLFSFYYKLSSSGILTSSTFSFTLEAMKVFNFRKHCKYQKTLNFTAQQKYKSSFLIRGVFDMSSK